MVSASWITIKPPPPMFPALGRTTANVKPIAIAASYELPPLLSIFSPTFVAKKCCVVTIPFKLSAVSF